jgi:hypothetical protein
MQDMIAERANGLPGFLCSKPSDLPAGVTTDTSAGTPLDPSHRSQLFRLISCNPPTQPLALNYTLPRPSIGFDTFPQRSWAQGLTAGESIRSGR